MLKKKNEIDAFDAYDVFDAYAEAKEMLFNVMIEIITDLATNRIFRQQAVYNKYLSYYESYLDKQKKFRNGR